MIGAEEVVVSSTGADYVFKRGYRLKPLSEVARYIEANHRLPDMPSAEEVKRKGMGVGEMEAKLLAKVEELTLHLIQEEKENQELKRRIDRLEVKGPAVSACSERGTFGEGARCGILEEFGPGSKPEAQWCQRAPEEVWFRVLCVQQWLTALETELIPIGRLHIRTTRPWPEQIERKYGWTVAVP